MILGPTPIITQDLKLHLNGASYRSSRVGSGDTWYDISGNENHCTLGGTKPTWADGVFTFTATTTGGAVPNIQFPTEQTVMIWMKW